MTNKMIIIFFTVRITVHKPFEVFYAFLNLNMSRMINIKEILNLYLDSES